MAAVNEFKPLTPELNSGMVFFISGVDAPRPLNTCRFSELLQNPDTQQLRTICRRYREISAPSSSLKNPNNGYSRYYYYGNLEIHFYYGNMPTYSSSQSTPHDVFLPAWGRTAMDFWRSDQVDWTNELPLSRHPLVLDRHGNKRTYGHPIQVIRFANSAIEFIQWPFQEVTNDNVFRFTDPNFFHFLIANEIDAEWRPIEEAMEVMTDAGLFINLPRSINILSFISERLLLNIPLFQPEKFSNFMVAIARQIGGKFGYSTAALIIENLIDIYTPNATRPHNNKQGLGVLYEAADNLLIEYSSWKYSQRPQFASTEALIEPAVNPPADLWEQVYAQHNIQTAVNSLLGNNDEQSNSIRESLTRERKVIPGLVLLTAQALGLEHEQAVDLAARAFFSWGVILAFDNILDGHKTRKGLATDVALSGKEISLDRTMISLFEFTRQSLGNSHLTDRMLEMLRNSFTGELESRKLGWNDPIETYLQASEKMVSAFSWFGQYIGEVTGRPDAGEALGAFFANINTLGQISNDFEDLSPGSKHETLADPVSRISIIWRAFMDLPDDTVEAGAKDFVIATYENALRTKTITQENLVKLQAIGLRYKKQVMERLKPAVNLLISETQWFLGKAFTNLPVDESNKTMMVFFEAMAQEAGQRFTESG